MGDRASTRKKVVPKFASFRPPSTSSGQERREFLCRRPDVFAETSCTNRSNYGNHPLDINDARERHEYRAATEGKTPQSFVVDKAGDPSNLNFGTLHQHATYSRLGVGDVLGASTGRRIDRAASTRKGLILCYNSQGSASKGHRRALRIASQSGTKELKIKPQTSNSSDLDAGVDFVSLSAAQGVKRKRNDSSSSHSSSFSDRDDNHYRSLAGKSKSKDAPDDPDLIYGSDASSSPKQKGYSPFTLSDSIQRKRMEFSRKINNDPANVNAWLDLIKEYDHNFGTLTNAERKSNADIKLSMYEKALSNVKDSSGLEILLLGKMGEGAQVWDRQKSLAEWQRILQNNPEYLRLWTNYLDFRQTTFASFNYEEVRNVFADCLSLLQRNQGAPGRLLAQRERIYDIQIHVTLRMTLFMRESGFVEQAVSAWQTLLEYEYNRPSELQDDEHKGGGPLHDVSISKFEEFWDSEVPRIGEDGCRGWASFCADAKNPPQPKTEIASIPEDAQDIWRSWVDLEHKHGLLARNPARTIDDVGEDDPYRVILFSDVKPFLADSPSVESRAACLDAFLAFCHLPPCQDEDPAGRSRSWWRDGHVHNETLCAPTGALQPWTMPSPEEQTLAIEGDKVQERKSTSTLSKRGLFDLPISEYQISSDSLFAGAGSWFAAFGAWQSEYSEDRGPMQKTWVIQSLKQLVATGAGGDILAEYVLALELHISPDTVKRTARALLKERPWSLRLYNAYALIEYRLGNACKGESVIITSIQMTQSLGNQAQRDSILLWRTWIWELLKAGNSKEALLRIMTYGDEEVQSALPSINPSEDQALKPALLLRTERALTATRDNLLSLRSHRHAALTIECLVVFQYLQTSLSLSAAISTFRSNISILSTQASSNFTTLEYLHQSFARLIYHHTTHTHLVNPSEVRSLLAESISLFPENTIFLSLYAWNEARFRIDDRVRSIVKDVVLRPNHDAYGKHQESVVSHFFAVHTELKRGITLGSNRSTIRSTFERAVGSNSGAHCAGLWKIYFLFEVSRGDTTKAKSVFWRCVKACPWVKELYMLAFEYLRGAEGLGDGELRGVYQLMGEKEIRIHANLEAYLWDQE